MEVVDQVAHREEVAVQVEAPVEVALLQGAVLLHTQGITQALLMCHQHIELCISLQQYLAILPYLIKVLIQIQHLDIQAWFGYHIVIISHLLLENI